MVHIDIKKVFNQKRWLLLSIIIIAIVPIYLKSQDYNAQTFLIYKGQPYAAFTGLTYYKNCFYCVFREGLNHVDGSGRNNGIIKIIRSEDGKEWSLMDSLKIEGWDMRDPSILITRDGRLQVLAFGHVRKDGKYLCLKSYVSISDTIGLKFSPLEPIVFNNKLEWNKGNVVWDLKQIDNTLYGFTYRPKFALVSTQDGMSFDLLQEFDIDGDPNEADLCASGNTMYAIARRDGMHAIAGKCCKGSSVWQWKDCGFEVGGPDIIDIDGQIYVCGRSYDQEEQHTTLFKLNKQSLQLNRVFDLPSYGDCSYPGMLVHEGNLYISHYHTDGKLGSSIYLTIIGINKIK